MGHRSGREVGCRRGQGLRGAEREEGIREGPELVGLQWIRLDTTTFDHPKLLELAEEKQYRAIVTHLSGMTYTGKHGLDGWIPRSAMRVIGGQTSDAKKLIEVGLWHEVAGGWAINGWDEYQVSDEESKTRKQRAKKGGCIKNHGIDCGCWML